MNLAQFTATELLLPCLRGEHRDCVIAELGGHLEAAGRVDDARTFADAVLDHESRVSIVFDEVAFSQARAQAVRGLAFALGLSPKGVRWGAGRLPVVRATILFAVPLPAAQSYLSLVVTFSKFAQNQEAFLALRQCTKAEEMLSVLGTVPLVRIGPQPPASH